MDSGSRVLVLGCSGLIGSAFVRRLGGEGLVQLSAPPRSELDLMDAAQVRQYIGRLRPHLVVLAAGAVGGIRANIQTPADFMATNLQIQAGVFAAAVALPETRVLFFGSSCMYPRAAPVPMKENLLLTGRPEDTTLPYAISKIAGLYQCLSLNAQHGGNRFVPVIPNTVYGPYDNFDTETAHVVSALIAKLHTAKRSGEGFVRLWGTGTPTREFIFSDDVADACLFVLKHLPKAESLPINIGVGSAVSIADLADIVGKVVGFRGTIQWDNTRPDGAPRKLLDSSRLFALGWKPRVSIEQGIEMTYDWYLRHIGEGRS